MFTVKEVSEIMGISPHTLRFYDKEGLFPNLIRDNNGRRNFTKTDLQWISTIQCLRDTGMPLTEILRYIRSFELGDDTLHERYEMILKQKEKVKEDLAAVKRQLKELERKTEYYKALMRGDNAENWLPDVDSLIAKAQRRGAVPKDVSKRVEVAA